MQYFLGCCGGEGVIEDVAEGLVWGVAWGVAAGWEVWSRVSTWVVALAAGGRFVGFVLGGAVRQGAVRGVV